MGNSHNCSVIGNSIYLIFFRDAVFPDDQGMISCHLIFLRQACKHAGSVIMDLCYFSMHGAYSLFHYCACTVADNLMAQTDTQDRNPSLKFFYRIYTELRIPGTFRSRRKNNPFRIHRFQLLKSDLITAFNQYLSSQFLKICLQIIYK